MLGVAAYILCNNNNNFIEYIHSTFNQPYRICTLEYENTLHKIFVKTIFLGWQS